MDQNGNENRPVLKSAEELKGKKAKSGRKGKKWIAVVICAVLLGGMAGIYYGTDLLTPDEVLTESTDVVAENIRSTLIERNEQDFDRISISIRDGDAYTIVSNIQYDDEGNAIDPSAAPEPADEAGEGGADADEPEETPEVTAQPDADGETPEANGGSDTAEAIGEIEILPNYTIEDQPYFQLKESSATSIVAYAKNLVSQHTVEENAEDVAMYGLDNPSLTLNMYYRDGTSETIFIGDLVPTGSYRYASKAGDSNVYMVLNGVYTALNKELNSLHVVEMPIILDLETIETLTVEQQGKETVELEYLTSMADDSLSISVLRLVQPIQYDAHSTRGQEVLEAAIAVAINGYAGHAETEEELAAFGLAAPRASIRMTDHDGNDLTFRIGSVTGSDSYAQIDDTGDIYTVPNSSLTFLQNMRVGYLADQFTNIVNILKVEKVTVTGAGNTYVLDIKSETAVDDEGDAVVNTTYFFDGGETEEKPFKKLYQEIIGTLQDNVSDDYHYEGEVVASVTYKVNTGAEDFVVEYLEYDNDYYAVRRDGLTLFLIKRDKITQMLEYCQQYREGTFTY